MTPLRVTALLPIARVPVSVPPSVPVPAFRLRVIVLAAPVLLTALPKASARVTLTLKPVPATWLAMVAMTSWLAAPAVKVTVAWLRLLMAVALPPARVSVAVMASVPAAVLLTVTLQVDAPAVIVQVGAESVLPVSGEVKVMV